MGEAQYVTRSILGLLFSRRGGEQKKFEVKRSLMGKEKDPAKYRGRYFTRPDSYGVKAERVGRYS